MKTEIPKEKWTEFFNELSKRCFGWKTKVEILDKALGGQILSEGLPFDAIIFEEMPSRHEIELSVDKIRQAKTAAANIASEIRGEEPSEYYYHEMATIIDAGGPDSIYLHFGIWDEQECRLKKGAFWGRVKKIHDKLWRAVHQA